MLRCPKEQHRELQVSSSVCTDDTGLNYRLVVFCGICGAMTVLESSTAGWHDGVKFKGRKIFERSEKSIAYNGVVGLHNAHQTRAQQEARKLVTRLRQRGLRELAEDDEFLAGYWEQVGVSQDHRELATEIVRATIDL